MRFKSPPCAEDKPRYRAAGAHCVLGKDLTPDQMHAVLNSIKSLGEQRVAQLAALVKCTPSDGYVLPHAYIQTNSSFIHRANYEYMLEKYPWLHRSSGCLTLDPDLAEEEPNCSSLADKLQTIPHADWTAFLEDVAVLTDDDCAWAYMNEERATELETAESNRWLEEDGTPELIKELLDHTEDAYEAYLFSKITPELVDEWCRETENWPEGQGEGTVYMDMEHFAEKPETHQWFLDRLGDDRAGWEAIKQAFYEENSEDFDDMLRQLAAKDERIAYTFNVMDAAGLRHAFNIAFPDERAHTDDPVWYRCLSGYGDARQYKWAAGYDPLTYWQHADLSTNNWRRTYVDALIYLSNAPWFLEVLRNGLKQPPCLAQ